MRSSHVILLGGVLVLGVTGATSDVGDLPQPVGVEQRAARLFERSRPNRAQAIRVGERLIFSVRYGPIHAGTATIAVEGIAEVEGDSCFHVASTAESNDFFSTFFYVRDRVESFIDTRSLLPRRFEKHLLEGDYRKDEVVIFDRRNNLAVYDDGRICEVLPGVQDVLSAFYDVRMRDLSPGDTIYLDCHTDHRNYALKTQVYRRERVEVPAGEFDCLVMEPMLRTPGLFRHEGSLTIWVTDDARKIPVQMKSRLPIGSIAVVLTAIEGRETGELP